MFVCYGDNKPQINIHHQRGAAKPFLPFFSSKDKPFRHEPTINAKNFKLFLVSLGRMFHPDYLKNTTGGSGGERAHCYSLRCAACPRLMGFS